MARSTSATENWTRHISATGGVDVALDIFDICAAIIPILLADLLANFYFLFLSYNYV